MFMADQQGQGDAQATSNCYDACAEAWPPLMAEGEPQAGEGTDAGLIGAIERQGGGAQVTYGGWPLYYFVRDQAPGDVNGQGVDGFGAEWYLVGPHGQVIRDEGQ